MPDTDRVLNNSEYIRSINRAIDFLDSRLDMPPTLAEVAEVAGFSSFHFHRIFKVFVGENINECVNRMRLEKSARLLKLGKKKLKDIAAECGYDSAASFSRAFSNSFGISPRDYRETGTLKDSKIRKVFSIDSEYIASDEGHKELSEKYPIEIKMIRFGKVAYIRSWNSYADDRCLRAFERLQTWADQNDAYKKDSVFFQLRGNANVNPLSNPIHSPATFSKGNRLRGRRIRTV